jgi:class 3 adenylate cyclase
METSMILNPPTDSESRLSRAAELAEYLRQNPKEARREAEELGTQFGLSAALAAQIQASVSSRSTAPSRKRKSLAELLKALSTTLLKIAERCVSQPFAFVLVSSVATALDGFYIPEGTKMAVAVWCGLLAWVLLLKPRFRYVVFSSALLWLVSGILFSRSRRGEEAPAPLSWPEVSVLFGMAMAILNLMLGGILVVAGGSIQIAAQRRKSAALSRQDLVMRMFELQHQLASLPAQTPKPAHPWIVFARQRPFLTASVLVFVVASLVHLNALLFHVDVYAFEKAREIQQKTPSKNGIVVVSGGMKDGSFLVVESILGLISTAGQIGLGFLANSWRKVWLILGGMFAGFCLAAAWAIPAGALGTEPVAMAATRPVQEVLSGVFFVLIVRFAVGFNRGLTTYRAGGAPDEATIVGELLEIRHRLSAHPATICVLVVDAAGSTQMKKVDDPLRVEYSFGRYQNWISKIVGANGGKVEIRTGDGAICAFGSAELALDAARQIQTDIRRFNETENKLDLPFRLRVALHAGLVQAELDKVQFTEVIDVAAHTEKYSPVGGIALTEAFVHALSSRPDLPVCATVDGFEVRAMTVDTTA